MFALRISKDKLHYCASRYDVAQDEKVETIAQSARQQGHLTKDQFLTLCHWKSPRSQPRCAANDAEFVEEVTRTCLLSCNERFRIEGLTILQGVSFPTASVILHFCSKDPYPILDIRALWSVGLKHVPALGFSFWWDYTLFCRKLAADTGMSMRALDRALWQYSKIKQKAAKA